MLYSQKLFFIVLLSLFTFATAFAQSNDSVYLKTDTLQQVEIVSDKKINATNAITPQQQISSKNISEIGLLQASDALKYFSGVNVKDYGGVGGLKTISVRGFGANQTAVSYDGVKVSGTQSGQIDLSKFSLDNVNNITLYNGQNEDIFQSASMLASTSVLAIKTLMPEWMSNKKQDIKLSLKVGSFSLINPSFTYFQKINNKITLSTNGEWLSSNGKYPFKLATSAEGVDTTKHRKNSDVKTYRIEATLFSKFSAKNSGYLKASYYNSTRGLPGAVIYYNENANSSQRLASTDFFTQAHFQSKLNAKFEYKASAKYSRNYTLYDDSGSLNTSGETKNKYIQQEIYGTLSILYKPTFHFSFAASSDLAINKLNSNLLYFAFPKRTSSLTSVTGKYANDWLSFSASMLYTQTLDKVKYGTPFENQQKLSPYAGFSIQPLQGTNLRLRAFYKNIFRLPTFNELYYTYFGTRDLKPEDTNQFNLGITYSWSSNWLEHLSITTDIYHNNVKNKIVAFPSSNLFYWSMTNYGSVSIYGSDINISGKINFSDKVNLSFTNALTYLKALDKTNPNSGTYNNQLPYLPRFSGASSAVLDLKYFLISYSIIWSGKRYYGYQNTTTNRLPVFTDHSVLFSKKIRIKNTTWNAGLQLLNITNKNYEIVKNYPMPGRNFRINLSTNI